MYALRRLLFTISVTMVTPATTYADWQYTKWGMSLEELLSLENPKIIRTTPKEFRDKSIDVVGQAQAKTTYVADGRTFEAIFYFGANKLTGVSLVPSSLDDALKVNNSLELIYGKPIEAVDKMEEGRNCRSIRRKWRSEPDGNVVSFDAYFCIKTAPYNGVALYKILYQPVLSSKKLGL